MDKRRSGWSFSPYGERPSDAAPGKLKPLKGVRYNPGNLRALCYIPNTLAEPAPLVVVLHGCTQTAEDYDRGSGWSRLAERHGFALLYPEQKEANNARRCFNWFQAGDSQRGMGEPASIKAMVDAIRAAAPIDEARIFVTGLSAGGAMASVMLATYPELFAAGGIIAGIPYGCASDVREAFDCMGGRARAKAEELADKVRRASPHKGVWPRVSVWQGSADHLVVPSNASALVAQWAQLHGLDPTAPTRTGRVEGYPYEAWTDDGGRVLVERYDITGMAHGTPLMPGEGDGESGTVGAHMLDARISSTDRLAAFFGLAPEPAERAHARATPAKRSAKARAARLKPEPMPHARPSNPWELMPGSEGVRQAIEDALKAAGLLK